MNQSGETITISQAAYDELLAAVEANEGSRKQLGVFQQWCGEHKGTTDLRAGLAACTTEELREWMSKQGKYIGFFLPLELGAELCKRILAEEEAERAAREKGQHPVAHVSPWGGGANGG